MELEVPPTHATTQYDHIWEMEIFGTVARANLLDIFSAPIVLFNLPSIIENSELCYPNVDNECLFTCFSMLSISIIT